MVVQAIYLVPQFSKCLVIQLKIRVYPNPQCGQECFRHFTCSFPDTDRRIIMGTANAVLSCNFQGNHKVKTNHATLALKIMEFLCFKRKKWRKNNVFTWNSKVWSIFFTAIMSAFPPLYRTECLILKKLTRNKLLLPLFLLSYFGGIVCHCAMMWAIIIFHNTRYWIET